MARGWESKDVESRIQDSLSKSTSTGASTKGGQLTPEQQARTTRLHLLEQQQARLLAEMREAKTDRMLDLLRREIAWVQAHIKELQ